MVFNLNATLQIKHLWVKIGGGFLSKHGSCGMLWKQRGREMHCTPEGRLSYSQVHFLRTPDHKNFFFFFGIKLGKMKRMIIFASGKA